MANRALVFFLFISVLDFIVIVKCVFVSLSPLSFSWNFSLAPLLVIHLFLCHRQCVLFPNFLAPSFIALHSRFSRKFSFLSFVLSFVLARHSRLCQPWFIFGWQSVKEFPSLPKCSDTWQPHLHPNACTLHHTNTSYTISHHTPHHTDEDTVFSNRCVVTGIWFTVLFV